MGIEGLEKETVTREMGGGEKEGEVERGGEGGFNMLVERREGEECGRRRRNKTRRDGTSQQERVEVRCSGLGGTWQVLADCRYAQVPLMGIS